MQKHGPHNNMTLSINFPYLSRICLIVCYVSYGRS